MTRGAKFLSIGTIIFILIILVSSKFIRPLKDNFVSPFPFEFLSSSSLKGKVGEIIKDPNIRYGIYIKNLNSDEKFVLNENQKFEAASLYKLWVAGAIFNKINKGELDQTDSIEFEAEELNKRFNISQDEAEIKEGSLNYTVKSALELMITISHNYAAFSLLTKTSNSEVNSFIKDLGLKNSSMSFPIKTTPEDMALFYEKLYRGEVVNPEYSKQMLEILKRQQLNDRLPKYLPRGTIIAHKTGNLDLVENDAGIIFTPNGDYIIVVLTESKKPIDLREKIAQISKVVFEYFGK